MLTSLTIRNVVLIEELTINFKVGLCALTGETGAGKSILLDSMGLALGARSESSLVRKGTEQASVTAVFEMPDLHVSEKLLNEAGLDWDNTLILRRTVTAEGRSKAFINDQPVSAALLRGVGESLVEIHGQFDTRGLLNASTHRQMLDDYAGLSTDVPALWSELKEKQEKLEALKNAAQASREEETYLRAALEDLDELDPQTGEEEKLASLRERLMNREQVLEALNAAYHALNGENDPVREAWSTLDRVADKIGAEASEAISALDRASSEIQEAIASIQSLSSDLQHSDHDLQTIDDRLFGLRAQARKHACEVDDLPRIRGEIAQKLNAIEHADEHLVQASQALEAAKVQYLKAAQGLSQGRKEAAAKLDDLVAAELPPLKMERARFTTRIQTLDEPQWGAHGIDAVQFLVATNPGSDPGPLGKIASGGEMSRFMLALKVVMAEVGAAQTLVFDEVDAGIGGGTADAVGERLSRLASKRQIMVVTHSPQVAARASHHWIVQKGGEADIRTHVVPLPEIDERREEIARMLAGASITPEARAAAEKLLEKAA